MTGTAPRAGSRLKHSTALLTTLFANSVVFGAVALWPNHAAANCVKSNDPTVAHDYFINEEFAPALNLEANCQGAPAGPQELLIVADTSIFGFETGVATGDGDTAWTIRNNGDITGLVTGVYNTFSRGADATSIYNNPGRNILGESFGINSPGLLTLNNDGAILSNNYIAVKTVLGGDVTNNINGVISGGYGPENDSHTGGGIVNYSRVTVNNHGEIKGKSVGVTNFSNGDATIINHDTGMITGRYGVSSAGFMALDNRGLVYGDEYGVVNFSISAARRSSITNKQDGTITGDKRGVYNIGALTIDNAGDITGGSGIYGGGTADTRIINRNSGSINGDTHGVNSFGLLTLTNSGAVEGGWYGVRSSSIGLSIITNNASGSIEVPVDTENASVIRSAVLNTGVLQITNFGDIGAREATYAAENFYDMRINNTGQIGSALNVGTAVLNHFDLTLDNSGRIEGRHFGVRTGEESPGTTTSTFITNQAAGTIVGGDYAIQAVTGPLSLTNAGTINGDVQAGAFNDTLELHTSSKINGRVDLGSGVDTLRLAGSDRSIEGYIDLNDYKGFDALEKTGDVVWTINTIRDESEQTIPFRVDKGPLFLETSIAPDLDFTVAYGATLGGHNSAINSLTAQNGAVIAPGGVEDDALGALFIDEDVVFKSGSTYEADVSYQQVKPGTVLEGRSDEIQARGEVRIEPGATLRINVTDPTEFGQTRIFTVITASGGIEGVFTTVTDNLPDIDLEAGYSNSNVVIALQPESSQSTASTALASTSNFSPKEIHPSGLMASLDNTQQFADTLLGRGATITAGPTATGLAMGAAERPHGAWWAPLGARAQIGQDIFFERDDAALGNYFFSLENNFNNGAPLSSPDLTGAFSRTSIADDGAVSGWAAAMGGLVFGVDYNLHDAGLPVAVGFASGFSRTDIASGASGADLEAWHLGVYANHEAKAFSVSGALAYTHHKYDFSRAVAFGAGAGEANSDTHGDSFIISGEAFYDLAARSEQQRLRFGPVATFNAVHATRDGFTETGLGILNLTVEDEAIRQATSGVGGAMRLSPTRIAGMRVSFEGRLLWEHVYGDVNARTVSSIPLAGASFETLSARPSARNRAAVGLSAAVAILDTVSLYTNYDGTIDSNTADHRLAAGLSWRF